LSAGSAGNAPNNTGSSPSTNQGGQGGSVGASGGSERGRETGDHETAPETLGKGIQEGIGEYAPASNPYDSDAWDTLKDVPFAGNNVGGSNQSAQSQMRTYGENWAASLPDSNKTAINDYTKESPKYYENINNVLRGKEKNFAPGNEERSRMIHEALSSASTPCDMTVYRGCSEEALGKLKNLPDSKLVGQTFIDKGFASTSMSKGGAFNREVLLEIHLPAGSRAANIESLSEAGKYEEEVLIDRGQVFQIVGTYRDEFGRRIVKVNAVNL
jgi:hypothetical protein